MVVWNQHGAARRENLDKSLADQFAIGISECFICDLPYLFIGRANGLADCVEVRATSNDNGSGQCAGVYLLRCSQQFRRGVIGDATLVCNVSEDSRHYFNPPLAATNSTNFSMFSSRLPCRISAPLPSAGTKQRTRCII